MVGAGLDDPSSRPVEGDGDTELLKAWKLNEVGKVAMICHREVVRLVFHVLKLVETIKVMIEKIFNVHGTWLSTNLEYMTSVWGPLSNV